MKKGQYLVLSTSHIRSTTAQLLHDWAGLPPAEQPVAVASTHYGWFLLTIEPAPDQARQIPDELPAILELGRIQQCDYVLLDCDGPEEEILPIFPW